MKRLGGIIRTVIHAELGGEVNANQMRLVGRSLQGFKVCCASPGIVYMDLPIYQYPLAGVYICSLYDV